MGMPPGSKEINNEIQVMDLVLKHEEVFNRGIEAMNAVQTTQRAERNATKWELAIMEQPEKFVELEVLELKDWGELEGANFGSSVLAALLGEFGSRLQEVPNMEADVISRITGILAREFENTQPHNLKEQHSDESEGENYMGSKINALVEDLQGRHLQILEVLMLVFEKDAAMIERTNLEILDFSDTTHVSEERQAVERQRPLISVNLQNVPVPRSSVICCIDDDFAACYMCLPIFCSPTTEIRRLENGMKHAINAYNKSANLGLQNGPYIVANQITRCSYEKWISNIESSWRVSYFYNEEEARGSVVLYGDPSSLHENVTFWFEDSIGDQARQNLGCRLSEIAYGLRSSTQTLANGSQKEPDASFTCQSADPTCLPRVTLEVAYKNEDLSELVREVKNWHDSGVLLSLGVKIEAEERSFYWVQQESHDVNPKVVNFSPEFCDESNQLQYKISFPFSYVTIDFDLSRDFPMIVDLFELQKFIVRCELFEARRNRKVLYVDEKGKHKVGKDAACPLCQEGFGERFMILCEKCKFWYHVSCVCLDECNIPSSWCCNNCC